MTHKSRLLHQIIPLEYDILLKPDLKEFIFTGEETIICTLIKPTKTISLHANNVEVIEAFLLVGETKHAGEISYNKKDMHVILRFPNTLSRGEKKIQLTFKGVIGEKLRGWYKSAYTVNGEIRHLATTQFEEIGAREVFPSIDDPSAKAIFHISFLIPKHLTAISNTIDSVVAEHENGYKTVRFTPTPKMASYALAFIVGEFEYIERMTTSGVNVRVFVTPGKKSQAEFALDTAVKMLPFYEAYFDIQYPLPILDLIAIPDFDAGAMENWGAITAREVALLVDMEQTSSANKQWVATVIAHELTHMWFGNLVTMKWWDDLWLNEGFASYMEYVGLNEFFPQWQVWEQFAVLDHNRALGLDSLENTHPIQAKIPNVEKVAEIFDEVSYSKGASIIQMLVAFLGEKDFRKGLQHYLKKHAYANAETNDLWNALEHVSGKPVKKIMQVYTKKPGHPLVSVSTSHDSLLFTQTRFFSSATSRKKSKDTTLWTIPLPIASEKEKNALLLSKKSLHIPFSSDWIKVNKGEASFARVMYSADLYTHLEMPIKEKRISSIDRMGIIRDAFDSAESGYVSVDRALQLAKQYALEDAYIVWACLAGKLGKVENLIARTSLLPAFQAYARGIFQRIGQEVGWEKQATDSHDRILLRSVVLSSLGQYRDAPTIEKAQELFQVLRAKRNAVETDIRGIVYVLTAENGGRKEFEMLKDMYIKEDLPTEKNRIGNALCLFEDEALIQEALDFSLSTHVRSQDIGRFLVLSFGNKKGEKVTWDFVKSHWDELLRKMEGLGMSWVIEGATGVVDKVLAEDIIAFFAKHPYPKLEKTMKQVVEQIESNIDWLARDESAIEKFLQKAV